MTRWASPRPGRGEPAEPTANTMIIKRPTKKPGIDRPSMAKILQAVSQPVSTLTAVRTGGRPIMSETRSPAKASWSEFGSRWVEVDDGRRYWNETPKSPRATLATKARYCSARSGRSPSPRARCMSSARRQPHQQQAGSPVARTATKMVMLSRKRLMPL